jgi:hypothetical protein
MVGSIQADRSQRYLQMQKICTSVQNVKNWTKLKSTFWSVQVQVLGSKDMNLFIPWWRRSDRTTYAMPNKCLQCVSGPGLNLWKQSYQMWAVYMNQNVNCYDRQLLIKSILVGIWQCKGTSASTGDWQSLQIAILRRIMTRVRYG